MGKWLLALVLVVLICGIAAPHLFRRLRIGALPGDFTVRWRGRQYCFPFTSTFVLSLLAYLLLRLL